jgi:hypothetical protein
VVGAKVTATNEATGVKTTVETSSAGTYDFPKLLPGLYTVSVEAPGFAKYERHGVRVEAGLIAEVNAPIKPGAIGEVIEVTAGADLVNTASSSITNTFQRVYDLPIGGTGAPNVLDLAVLIPNVTAVSGTTSSSISVGGNRTRFNNYTIDGADNNSASTTSNQQDVIPDAVQELVISTNLFSAEYGHSAAANFNVVTRTGTNNWHGAGWWYNQNKNYNALSNIDKLQGFTTPPRFDQQRVGGHGGGPLVKDKIFLFGAYEWFNQGSTASSTGATSVTSAGLAQLKTIAANSAVIGFLNSFPVASTQTGTTPVTAPGCNPSPCQVPVGSVAAIAPAFEVRHNFIINGDVNLAKHQLHTRYLDERDRSPSQGPFPDPAFSAPTSFRVKTAILNHVYSLSPRWVNDARVSYQRVTTDFPVPPQFTAFPNVTLTDLGLTIGPATNFPQSSGNNNFQLQDSMSYSAGRWNFKWGGEYRKLIGFNIFAQRLRGDYIYTDLTEFINDNAPLVLRSRNIGPPGGIGRFESNQSALYGYLQADWRVTTRLTFNMGVRYEWNGTPIGVQQNAENSIASLPGTPLVWGIPKSDKNNVSPRFGFAWDPTGSGKWAIRGGAMMAYDVYPGNFYLNQQPSQRSIFFFDFGTPTVGQGACSGAAFPVPSWCTSPFTNFLSSGAIPNVTPNITTQAVARALSSSLMVDQTMPKVIQTSIGVEHALWRDASIETRYQFTRGLELPVQAQLNTVTAFSNGAKPLPVFFTPSSIPATVPLTDPTLAQFNNLRIRPFAAQGFGSGITTFQPLSANRYHAVSVDFQQRSRWGLSARANYTWSRNFDDSTADLNTSGISQRRPQDITNLPAEWGRSALDVTHKFSAGYIYSLPKMRTESAILRGFLHGWEWGGSVLAQTGQPATALSAADANGNRDTAGDRAIFNPNGTTTIGTGFSRGVNFVCRNASTGATSTATSSAGCGGTANVVGYVARDPSQTFIVAQVGTIATVGRNTLSSRGLQIWNISLAKNTYFGENRYVQFRADLYNAFNHRNFTFTRARQASNGIASSSYSTVTSDSFLDDTRLDGGNRSMQLGLRLVF